MKHLLVAVAKISIIITILAPIRMNAQCNCPENREEWANKIIYPNCANDFMSCVDELRKKYDEFKKELTKDPETKMSQDDMYDVLLKSYEKLLKLFKTDETGYYNENVKYHRLMKSIKCECPLNKEEWNHYSIYPKCDRDFMRCVDQLRKKYDELKKDLAKDPELKMSNEELYNALLKSYKKLEEHFKTDTTAYNDDIIKYRGLTKSLKLTQTNR